MLWACQDFRGGCDCPGGLEGWKLGPEGRAKWPCDAGCDWPGPSMLYKERVKWIQQVQYDVQAT